MTRVIALIDYDIIKEILSSGEGKIQLVDSGGNIISDISLSDLVDALKGADNKDFSTLESDIESILDRMDITLSALRDALKGTGNKDFTTLEADIESILAKHDVALSTRASESTVSLILSQLDLTLSDLRDALRGAESKTLTDLDSSLASILGQLDITLSALRDALKPIRATPEQVLSGASIAGGDSEEFMISDADGYSAIVITVKATYNASATAGIRVRWLYSPDGTNFDSEDAAEAEGQYTDMTFAAGATKVETVLIPIFQPYVKVQVVNLDSSYAVVADVWKTLLR